MMKKDWLKVQEKFPIEMKEILNKYDLYLRKTKNIF